VTGDRLRAGQGGQRFAARAEVEAEHHAGRQHAQQRVEIAGAAYGVIVGVFQWGWLGAGIDNGATAPVDPWIPVMLFALLFGFSMDYQVFLVSRIREEWQAGHPDAVAVTRGLATTGRVITSAAAIMICVFAAFVLGDLRVLRVIGLGLAAAILLDATLVRVIIMPAVLQLTGRANWWFPRGLRRAVPSFLMEDSPPER
jgi:RND superfamily putative drug exporter